MSKPLMVGKTKMGEWLTCLNYHIKDLRAKSVAMSDSEEKRQLQIFTQELYDLKERVLLKLLDEGHVHVRRQKGYGKEYYLFWLKRDYSYHCPGTKRLREVIRAYESGKIAVQTEEHAPE